MLCLGWLTDLQSQQTAQQFCYILGSVDLAWINARRRWFTGVRLTTEQDDQPSFLKIALEIKLGKCTHSVGYREVRDGSSVTFVTFGVGPNAERHVGSIL